MWYSLAQKPPFKQAGKVHWRAKGSHLIPMRPCRQLRRLPTAPKMKEVRPKHVRRPKCTCCCVPPARIVPVLHARACAHAPFHVVIWAHPEAGNVPSAMPSAVIASHYSAPCNSCPACSSPPAGLCGEHPCLNRIHKIGLWLRCK